MLNVFDFYILLGVGVILIGLEAVFSSFIIIWFGIGCVLTAFISLYYNFTDGLWQLATISLIALALILILRRKLLEKFLKSEEEVNDNFLNESGMGIIKSSKVFYKGTFWEIETATTMEFEEGEKVFVVKTHKNSALIEKHL